MAYAQCDDIRGLEIQFISIARIFHVFDLMFVLLVHYNRVRNLFR